MPWKVFVVLFIFTVVVRIDLDRRWWALVDACGCGTSFVAVKAWSPKQHLFAGRVWDIPS